MPESLDEKIITIIGDAVLTLLNDNADISAATLSAKLRQMLDTETDEDHRQLTGQALVFAGNLFSDAVHPDDAVAEKSQPGKTLPSLVSRH